MVAFNLLIHDRGALCQKIEVLPLTDDQEVTDARPIDVGPSSEGESRGGAARNGEPWRKEGRDG